MRPLLLANLLGKLRNNTLKSYGLCPNHYLSAPRLSWDSMFKTIKIDLELIPDPGMYILFEKDTRDRVSYNSNRYFKVNIK